jgi:hypothetical protein
MELYGNASLAGAGLLRYRRIPILPDEPAGQQKDLEGASGGRIHCLMCSIIGSHEV